MLHRLAELDALVRKAYADFDYKRIFAALTGFMTSDLSAFYFDIRKDALYCDPASSMTRKACLDRARSPVPLHGDLARAHALLHRRGGLALALRRRAPNRCISKLFPEVPASWRDDKLAEKWRKVRTVRRVVTGALEIERAQKRIGSSLEAHPIVHVSDEALFEAVADVDLAEICITSAATLVKDDAPADAFRLPGRCRRRRGAQPRRGHQVRALVEGAHHHRRRSRVSRRFAARRPGAARMGNPAQGGGVNGRALPLRPAHPPRRHRGGARLPDRPGEQALPAAASSISPPPAPSGSGRSST